MCSCIFPELLRGRRWEGVHLQRTQTHRPFRDLPSAADALRGEVWTGKRQDHSGLKQGAAGKNDHLEILEFQGNNERVNDCLSQQFKQLNRLIPTLIQVLFYSAAGEPQRPGPQVCLHPGDLCQAILRREGGAREEDRFREVPQHQPLRLRDALHAVGQEARRRGGAVQEEERAHKYASL